MALFDIELDVRPSVLPRRSNPVSLYGTGEVVQTSRTVARACLGGLYATMPARLLEWVACRRFERQRVFKLREGSMIIKYLASTISAAIVCVCSLFPRMRPSLA